MSGDLSASAGAIYEAALTRYFGERHAMVDDFVDRHFTVRGALRIHRLALGLDVLRAPVNLLLTVPTAALKLSAILARKLGKVRAAHWLDTRNLFLQTAVSRRIGDLIEAELFGMGPHARGNGGGTDPIGEAILATPPVQALVARARKRDASCGSQAIETRLRQTLLSYGGARSAAGEITNAIISLSAGAIIFHQLTPGMLTLGPSLAALLAQRAAIETFPLGSWAGSLWYTLFPVSAPLELVIAITVGLVLLGAVLAAFSGVIADPIQRRLGLHQRRLHHLLDVAEENLRGEAPSSLRVRDHYVARVLDVMDYATVALRVAQGG